MHGKIKCSLFAKYPLFFSKNSIFFQRTVVAFDNIVQKLTISQVFIYTAFLSLNS